MKIETIDQLGDLLVLEPEWWELWRTAPRATPFQSPAWLLAWWQVFHPGRLAVATAHRNGRLVGLAPFYLEGGTDRLLPIGISLSDYLDILATDHETAQALLDFCASLPWSEWDLPDLRPESWVPSNAASSTCMVLPLPAVLSRSKRHSLALARNRAARIGSVSYVERADLEALLALNAQRWNSDLRVGAMLRKAVPAMGDMVRLHGVEIGGRLAAALLCFHHRDHAYFYMTASDPAFSHQSPGNLLLAHAIARAEREGCAEFDFLRGEENYKSDWGGEWRSNGRLIVTRNLADARA